MNRDRSLPIDLLQKAFDRLPQDQQQLVLLIRVEGLDYSQAGERMGLTVSQVERLLARALVSLDRHLEQLKCQGLRLW